MPQMFRNTGFVNLAVIYILSLTMKLNELKFTNNLPRRGHHVTKYRT